MTLAARMDLDVLKELTVVESRNIEKYEGELGLLGNLPGAPGEVKPRVKWLLGKLKGSQEKVEGYERESAGLKRILGRQY